VFIYPSTFENNKGIMWRDILKYMLQIRYTSQVKLERRTRKYY